MMIAPFHVHRQLNVRKKVLMGNCIQFAGQAVTLGLLVAMGFLLRRILEVLLQIRGDELPSYDPIDARGAVLEQADLVGAAAHRRDRIR